MAEDQPKKDWKVLERHYKALSEVWSYAYDDQTQISQSIMIMHGVLVEMHSEIIQFEIKHGSERVTKSYNRLRILEKQLANVSRIQDDYYRIKHHNLAIIKENEKLKSHIFDMEKSKTLKERPL